MLDDLRSSALEDNKEEVQELKVDTPEFYPLDAPGKKKFLGMSPAQRFIVASLLLLVTCVIGTACLVIFGKINFPF